MSKCCIWEAHCISVIVYLAWKHLCGVVYKASKDVLSELSYSIYFLFFFLIKTRDIFFVENLIIIFLIIKLFFGNITLDLIS